MSLILGGHRYEVPSVVTLSWLDDPRVPRTVRNTQPRSKRIRIVTVHTTAGRPTGVKPGRGTVENKYRWAQDSANNQRRVSWDYTVLIDGTVLVQTDPLATFTWHGNAPNDVSIGIEIAQTGDGYVYAEQLAAAAALIHALTGVLKIQRQIAWYNGAPDRRVLERLSSGGSDVVGVHGHRSITSEKSDPGDQIFGVLRAAGYEPFDFASGEDKRVWAARQTALGVTADGVPLDATVAKLEAEGHADGLWVNPAGKLGLIGWMGVAALAAVALYVATAKK